MIKPAKSSAKYIPAIRFNRLTPLYDPVIQLLTPEAAFKHRLVEKMNIGKGHMVFDIGCGTATLNSHQEDTP